MQDLTLADIEAELKRIAQSVADLRNDVTASTLQEADLLRRVEALEKRLGMSEER